MPKFTSRQFLLAGTVLAATAILPVQAIAAEEERDTSGIIIVTAQKREQNVQDVPIAVTALGGDALQANRVTNVVDLSGLAPGVTVRVSAGGSQLPVFTIRGITSFGVVPGSDKQVSQYLDGVFIASPRGSIFDLPDLERIEVLRGPQGTLFGRNATAGAVSIVTRDPTGEPGFRAHGTVGNRHQVRIRTSLDLPQFGPFSAYVSFLHDQRRGDIRNVGAGRIWDRTASPDPFFAKVQASPEWLGSKNTDAVFAALKFESGDFTTSYKFDWADGDNTPEGTGFVGLNPNAAAFPLINALIQSQPFTVPTAFDGKRPKTVANSFVVPSEQLMLGHNLTSTWHVNDSLTIKNIFGYRKSKQHSNSSLDGFSALPITAGSARFFGPAGAFLIGQPFLIVGSQNLSRSQQASDEIQINYDSDFLTLTVGGLWFYSRDRTNTFGFQGTQAFRVIFNGAFTRGNQTETFNKLTSLAAFAQAELHVTEQLDLILGGRLTRDKKFGRFVLGTAPDFDIIESPFRKTRGSYLVGVNFKPTDDILVYAKYSTAFVSGGSIAGFPFETEKAKSVEGGIKAQLLDRKVQANLALFWVRYNDAQSSSSATLNEQVDDRVGTFIITQGDITSKGFEFELTAAPVDGLRFGGSLAYADWDIKNVNPILLLTNSGGPFNLTFRPKWTAGLWGQYNTQPLLGEAYLSFRADASWQSKSFQDANPAQSIGWAPNFPFGDPYWLVNARVALRDIEVGGAKTEVALWSKNLFNASAPTFGLNLFNTIAAYNYIPARTYGVDLIVEY